AGYKSQGGPATGKPARAVGYKSHAAEGTGYKGKPDRAVGDATDRPAKKTYAPKGDAARPFVKRDGPKAAPVGGKRGYDKAAKPRHEAPKTDAPKHDAKDTSRRFVPPKGPKR
ncbi:MAG: hypothetical protein B7Z31_08005, partial [Rhodobacterales bacterium 12-65-15]